MFIPPINLGGWKPSPATMSEWIYQIWKYLQENPIATQEQIKQFIEEQIGDDIAKKLPDILPEELDKYFEENPIDFPVDSVNGKLGTVLLELADIVQSDSMLPVVSLANDEADQETLIESFEAGARICVIDEESASVMLPTYAQDGSVSAVTLLPMSSGGEGGDFSPITLSIGSSGNKTLNAGGTVAFTLTEIGAAPASLSGTVSTIQSTVGELQTDVETLETNVTGLQSAFETLTSPIDVRSQITITRDSSGGTNMGTATLSTAQRIGNLIFMKIDITGMGTTSNTRWNMFNLSSSYSVLSAIMGYPQLSSQNDAGKVQSINFSSSYIRIIMSSAQTANLSFPCIWVIEGD